MLVSLLFNKIGFFVSKTKKDKNIYFQKIKQLKIQIIFADCRKTF